MIHTTTQLRVGKVRRHEMFEALAAVYGHGSTEGIVAFYISGRERARVVVAAGWAVARLRVESEARRVTIRAVFHPQRDGIGPSQTRQLVWVG